MKKLMIAMAVVAMAACSQASMAYWSFTDGAAVKSGVDYFTGSADLTGYTAYLIAADDWDASDVAGSLGKAQATAPSSTWSKSTFDTEGKKSTYQTGTLKAKDMSVAEGTGSFYIVLADDENYWASSELTGVSVLADGSIETKYTAAKVQLGNATAIMTADLKPIGGDVPEPTSGLLLLLGMAGLALRRKQA